MNVMPNNTPVNENSICRVIKNTKLKSQNSAFYPLSFVILNFNAWFGAGSNNAARLYQFAIF